MFRSLQICGTSGSGKTTIAKRLHEAMNPTRYFYGHNVEGVKPKPITWYEGEFLGYPVALLGSYEKVCGGCDTIHSVKIVAELLRHMNVCTASNVTSGVEKRPYMCVFEGLMISHMVGTVGEAQLELGAEDHWRAYLDTSLARCLDNVVARRRAAGNYKPFNPSNTQADWPRVVNSRYKWEQMGGVAKTLRYECAWDDFVTTFQALAMGYTG